MRTRVMISVLAILLWAIFSFGWNAAQGPIQGSIAVEQLNGGNAEYATARAAATTDAIPAVVTWSTVLVLLALWLPPLVRAVKNGRTREDEPYSGE